MSLPIALLLSLALHAATIIAPTWLAAKPRPPVVRIEARLLPLQTPDATDAMAETPGTEASAGDTQPPTAPPKTAQPLAAQSVAAKPPTAPPRTVQGTSLHRAQTVFSEHLFYPPEAVSRGLEGEVILLLTLTENGRLVSAEIARSSGHALLDQAALDAAGRVGALPGQSRQILFPVSFRLR